MPQMMNMPAQKAMKMRRHSTSRHLRSRFTPCHARMHGSTHTVHVCSTSLQDLIRTAAPKPCKSTMHAVCAASGVSVSTHIQRLHNFCVALYRAHKPSHNYPDVRHVQIAACCGSGEAVEKDRRPARRLLHRCTCCLAFSSSPQQPILHNFSTQVASGPVQLTSN